MKWIAKYFARRRRHRIASDAARGFFCREFPQDKLIWTVIVEESTDFVVVGITYQADRRPPPYRFFRVIPGNLSVSALPHDYWPANWEPYR